MSTFGTIFKVTTYGESHCKSVGCIVENCPPGIHSSCVTQTNTLGMLLSEDDIQVQLSRRRPGQSARTTPVYSFCIFLTQAKRKRQSTNTIRNRVWNDPRNSHRHVSTKPRPTTPRLHRNGSLPATEPRRLDLSQKIRSQGK
jgi:chorismate synthase